jgi:hypothetical protein
MPDSVGSCRELASDVGEQLAMSVSRLSPKVIWRADILAESVSTESPLLASPAIYVGKLLHLGKMM